MPLPDQTPRLPKLPFLVGDAALLAAAWLVADRAPHPLPLEQALIIAGCVAVAAVVGAIPFLTDYARRQDEALDDRQRGLEALARTVATSAEQISIAAHGLHEIAAIAQKNLEEAQELPRKLEEKLAAFATASQKREVRAPKRVEPSLPASPPAPAEEKKPDLHTWESEPEPLPVPLATEPVADPLLAPSLPLDLPPLTAEVKAPRKPRKTKTEMASEPPSPDFDLPGESAAAAASSPSDFSQISPDEAAPAPAVSADGATRLLVTAYIGIGNRLFIRGDGPGLSWEKGVPLQFVSIGKWRWETADAAAPIRFRLYKNDEVECPGLGEGTLEPGRQQELTAGF